VEVRRDGEDGDELRVKEGLAYTEPWILYSKYMALSLHSSRE
jgi:hypothetical protein